MYPQIGSAADQVDTAFLVIFGVSVAILLGITCAGLYFVYRYHHSRHPEPAQIHGNVWAELAWTLIPTALVMVLFYYGWTSYQALRSVPADAMEVKVTARMWSWIFEYDNGKRSDVLVVPEGQAVRLNMTSLDVIHSFYVPAFRIKMDTVPGMETYTWFRHDEPGEFDILCAEYCGLKHANMLSVVRIVPKEEFDAWYAGESQPVDSGPDPLALLEQHGCLGCHSLDGSESIGPTLAGVYGRETLLEDGTTVVVDEAYITRAILDPEADIPEGFDPVMPGYEGMLPEEELKIIVTYLVRGEAEPELPGRTLAGAEGCLSCHSTDGTVIAGPSFRNLFMATVTDVDGQEHVADKEYLRQAIVKPEAVLSAGHDPIMPPYDYLSQEQVDDLVEYIVSLGNAPSPDTAPSHDTGADAGPDGAEVAEREGCLACHSIDGSESLGPSFKDLYRASVDVEGMDQDAVADEGYLRQAIVDPEALVREGYDPVMPPYDTMDPADVDALVAFIRSLSSSPPEPGDDGEPGDVSGQDAAPAVPDGAALVDSEGCLTCHTTDGSESLGPSLLGLFNRRVTDTGGNEHVADQGYLRQAITEPDAVVSRGYDPIMPPYDMLGDAEIEAIIDYLKELGSAPEDAPPDTEEGRNAQDSLSDGAEVAEREGCLACHSVDGSDSVGPTFLGMATHARDHSQAPDAYLRESIINPGATVHDGYDDVMPPYDYLNDADVDSLINYLASLSGPEPDAEEGPAAPAASPVLPDGMQVAEEEGCLSCHSLDGSRRSGPTLKGLYLSMVPTAHGSEVQADETYLRTSIVDPEALVRKGFGAFMPAYDHLEDERVEALIELIKTLE